MSRLPTVVPTLALLALGIGATARAEDRPFDLKPDPAPTSPTTGGAGVTGPGPLAPGRASLFAPASERQVFIQGLVDLDWLATNNYTDGDDDASDSTASTRIRGELGARVEIDERIEVKFTVGFNDTAGNDEAAYVDDAYAVLKELFGQPNLSVKLGRQPVAWNLRTDYGAFLFDSRADYPDITSWDGGRFQWGIETLVFTGFGYALPDESELYGAVMDWQPEQGRESGMFVTLSANWQKDAIDEATGISGKSLYTYYGGIEAKTAAGIDVWLEGAMQSGNAREGREYGGYGASAGFDWHLRTGVPVVLGVQGDWLQGDTDTADQDVDALQNTWEGQQDLLIVENERYGELSGLVQTSGAGLQAIKAKVEVGFDPNGRYKLKTIYGHYTLDEARGGEDAFGQELDLVFTWQYNSAGNAVIGLMVGGFLPDDGFEAIAPAAPATNDDPLFMAAASLQVAF